MGKRRRHSSSPDAWWRVEVGGMPVWGVLGALVVVAAMAVGVVVAQPQASTADPNRTPRPVPSFTFGSSAEEEPPSSFTAIAPTNGRERPLALIIGDSYSAGIGASDPETLGYPSLLGEELGWEAETLSAPGGGYSLPGVNGESVVDLFESADVAAMRPDVIVIQSGYNDTSAQDEEVRAAINKLRSDIASAAPQTPIVVVGQFWPGEPTPSSQARAATIQSAWNGTPNVLLLDPQAGGWSSFNTSDDRHPDDDGHALIADRIISAMRDAGLLG